jgi:large subunit ribosomal protein L5
MTETDKDSPEIRSRAAVIDPANLRNFGLFGAMSETVLEHLAEHLTILEAEPGTYIFREGDDANSMYVVLQGDMEVLKRSKFGPEARVAVLGPGDWFGEMGVIDVQPRSASVLTVSPNVHQIPKVAKIVLNSGVKADAEKTVIQELAKDITMITGQKPIITKSRKAVANFKLRENQPIGVKVTLRGRSMYEFLYRLIAVALPTIRDFRGLSGKLDGQGNYNLGITDITIFPEISVETHKAHPGLDIAIITTADTDDEARELLRLFGMPFRRPEAPAKAPTAA